MFKDDVLLQNMESRVERSRAQLSQQSLRNRVQSRGNGFVPLTLGAAETIPQLFSRQVSLHCHRPAIVGRGTSMTYGELDRASGDLAASLPREADRNTTPIAILVTDPVRFAVCALGVLRSGAFYVPLDASFPEERNTFIMEQSGARCVVTDGEERHVAERLAGVRSLVDIDQVKGGGQAIHHQSRPDDPACIIFTSGSTGRPKGVMQTHGTVLRVMERFTNSLGIGFHDRIPLLASCSVMGSVGTIFGTLLNGAALHSFSVRQEGLGELARWLDSARITVYRSVPSLFRNLMNSTAMERVFSSVQLVQLGGDSVYRDDWKLFTRHFPVDSILVNTYGCSELGNITAFYFDAASEAPDGVLPVGYPFGDVRMGVMSADRSIHWIACGNDTADADVAVGEIVLQSRYLSPGYWNDRTATGAAFSEIDAEDGVRLYKTGDLGLARADHGLVHVGREDSQVKLSGFRVEIAEVEACLRDCQGVRDAAVIVHALNQGEHMLVGFVEMDPPGVRHASSLRSHIQVRLPAHMVPSEILALDAIPRTPNGKVDRPALARLREERWQAQEAGARVYEAPQGEVEIALASIWIAVLGVERVGRHDNFFSLGGTSLGLLVVMNRVEETLTVTLEIEALYSSASLAHLARSISEVRAGQEDYESGVV